MDIELRITRNYGRAVAYPANPEAHLLANMLGTKTLSRDALWHINQLGHRLIVTQICGAQVGIGFTFEMIDP